MKQLFNKQAFKDLTLQQKEKYDSRGTHYQDDNVQRIQKAFDRSDLGCARPHVQEIINVLIEMIGGHGKVYVKKDRQPFEFGAFITTTGTTDSDGEERIPSGTYLIEQVDNDYDATLIAADGKYYRYLRHSRDQWNFANDEEIDAWFDVEVVESEDNFQNSVMKFILTSQKIIPAP